MERPDVPRGSVSDPAAIVRWLAVAAAALVTFVVTRNGVIVTPDSVRYLSGAESLVRGDGVLAPTGEALVLFPPGTSFVYAAAEILPVSTDVWVRVVNAACAAASVAIVSSLLARVLRSGWVAAAASVFAAVPVGLLFVTRAAWSEPLFVLAIVGFVAALVSLAGADSPANRPLLVCAATVWIACLFRYAGIVLAPVAVIVVAVAARQDRLRRALGVGVAAAAGPVALLTTNWIVSGSATGDRASGVETVGNVLRGGLDVVGSWVLPIEVADTGEGLRLAVGAVAGLGLVAATTAGLIRVWRFGPHGAPRALVASVAGLTALGSFAVVGFSQLRTALDPVDLRLVAPALLPSVIVFAVMLDVALDRYADRLQPIRWVAAAVVIGLIAVQFAGARRFVEEAQPERWHYTHPRWVESDVAAGARELGDDVVVWTNDPFALWALSDHRDIVEAPRSGSYRSTETYEFPTASDLPDRCGTTWLVWFDAAARFHHPPERLLTETGELDRQQRSDGRIWLLPPSSDCA